MIDEVQDCVGIGSTAAVLRTLDRSSGLVVAVKITNSTETNMDMKIANEESIYYRLIRKPSPSLKYVGWLSFAGSQTYSQFLLVCSPGF